MVVDDFSTWPCGLIETDAQGVIAAANDTIVRWTGYPRDELLGRAFRDLLSVGSRLFYETHVAPMVTLHGAADEVALDLRTADGGRLSTLVNVASGHDGAADHRYLSVVSATQRRSYERELLLARREAEAATAAAELAQDRLELAAEVDAAMRDGSALTRMLTRVADAVARHRQGVCFVVRTPAHRRGDDHALAVGVSEPSAARADELADRLFADPGTSLHEWPAWLRPNRSRLYSGSPTDGPATVGSSSAGSSAAATGPMMVAPIRAGAVQVAALVLVRDDRRPDYDAADLEEIDALSVGIGLRLDNLRLSAGEHDRAMSLQRALLTPAVGTDGLDIATTYLPSAEDAMVGGDWYDSFVRPDGTIVLVIGDVTGHDHVAAAAMGQLRGLLRAIAYLSVDTPAGVLTAVDASARGLGVAVRATAILAYLGAPDGAGARTLQWAVAGHPPPAVVRADATVRWLDARPDVMLGVAPDRPRVDRHTRLDPDDTVVFYTDGLIENRHRDIDTGLAQLGAALSLCAGRSPEDLSTGVLAAMAADRQEDDIALLVVRNGAARANGSTSSSASP